MNSITQNKRYCPHEITTKINSVKAVSGNNGYFICLPKISYLQSLSYEVEQAVRRDKGIPDSQITEPHTAHPNAHTEQELKWICDYHRRSPNISICELYGKLREKKAYKRHPGYLYRVFVRLGFRNKVESTKKKSKHTGKYDTPAELGVKWQLDVKYVPTACHSAKEKEQYYQYTVIEEASRKRFIYAYQEQSSYSTVDFVKERLFGFGYAPAEIQTDCGTEFTHTAKRRSVCILSMCFAAAATFITMSSDREHRGTTASLNEPQKTIRSVSITI